MWRQVELFSNEDWKHYFFISFQRLADGVFGGVAVGLEVTPRKFAANGILYHRLTMNYAIVI